MTKLTLIISAILLFASCTISKQNNTKQDSMETSLLELYIKINTQEHSKDSNSSLISLSIKNKTINYTKEYFGFRANEKKEKFTKEISQKQEQKIINFIENNKLNSSLEEKQDTKGIGISKEYNFKISKPFQSKILIVGKSNIWGSDDYVKKEWGKKYVESRTNIKNTNITNNIDNLIFLIKNM